VHAAGAQALEAGDATKLDERAAVLAHRLFTEIPIRAEQVAREPER